MHKLFTYATTLFLLTLITLQSCNNAKQKQENNKVNSEQLAPANQISMYYFHGTRRCATCIAVESVTKETLSNYSDKVQFQSINREEEKNNPLIKKYQISGQSLILVKGDKIINLTNEAFMNARTNPDKLKNKIKTSIDSII